MFAASKRLGVSACLLGLKLRYDGGHELAPWLVEGLGPHLELVPICPEQECGLGVPREPIRLVGEPDAPRVLVVRTGLELTARMQRWIRRRIEELERDGLLCGFVFKSRSPSCGLRDARVYPPGSVGGQEYLGTGMRTGMGLWARALQKRFPMLPKADEVQLREPGAIARFLDALDRGPAVRRPSVPGNT